jgi:UDP-N-acetyl-D-galactosamine dehydrogenase
VGLVGQVRRVDEDELAVPHRQYLAGGWHGITHHLDQRRGVVMDVKGKLDRATCPDGVLLWRL